MRRSIKEFTAVVGIDLAGVPHRPSGICLLRGAAVETLLLYGDQDIVDYVMRCEPALVAVDAPLSLPPGRRSLEDRNGLHLRPCDEDLRRRGIPFFPITLGPMRGLTRRGMALRERLEETGFRVVEIYPGGAQDIWGLPRAKRNRVSLRNGLIRFGLEGLSERATEHELDAASGALVGRLFLEGKAEVLGDFSTGAIILPRASLESSRANGSK